MDLPDYDRALEKRRNPRLNRPGDGGQARQAANGMEGFRMSVPGARRIVVGVDSSAESAAALRWACREASLRGAEVHAVHAIEAPCHSTASYAVSAQIPGDDVDADVMWQSVLPDPVPGVSAR